MKNEVEIWVDIKGYEGIYMISNLCRVKSLSRIKGGKGYKYSELILKPMYSVGYQYITLCKNSKCKKIRLHRLLAQHFIPNPENKTKINHKNGVKDDNKLENLEWCTNSENSKHSWKIGTQKVTEKMRLQGSMNIKKVNDIQRDKITLKVDDILRERKGGMKLHDIASKYKVGFLTVKRILKENGVPSDRLFRRKE